MFIKRHVLGGIIITIAFLILSGCAINCKEYCKKRYNCNSLMSRMRMMQSGKIIKESELVAICRDGKEECIEKECECSCTNAIIEQQIFLPRTNLPPS